MISVPRAAATRAAAAILLVMLAVTFGLITLMRMRLCSRSLSRPAFAALWARREDVGPSRPAQSEQSAAAAARDGGAPGREHLPEVDRLLRQPIKPQALLDTQQMGAHRLIRDIRPLARQRFDNLRVLVDRAAGFPGRLVDANDERGARDQLAQESRDCPVAGELGQQQVELAGQTDQAAPVTGRLCLLLCHVTTQPLGAGWRQSVGEPVDHMGLERAPRLEHLACLLDRRTGDERAAVWPGLHHMLAGKALQHPTDQGPADPEDLTQRLLAQLGAGRQPLLDDGTVDLGVDGVGGCGHRWRELERPGAVTIVAEWGDC